MSHPDHAAGTPITVQIPAGLSSLIPPFLSRRRTDVEDLATALDRDDFAAIQTIGHRMNGNGASMGFAPISRIGEALEAAAPTADRRRIELLTHELRDYLDRVDVAYQ